MSTKTHQQGRQNERALICEKCRCEPRRFLLRRPGRGAAMDEDHAAKPAEELAAKDAELAVVRAELLRAKAERDAALAAAVSAPAASAPSAAPASTGATAATEQDAKGLEELEQELAQQQHHLAEAMAAGQAGARDAAPLRRLADLAELVANKRRRKDNGAS